MNCTRCRNTGSQQMTFVFKHNKEKVELIAHSCKVCGNLWAEDKELLRAAKKHLKVLTKQYEWKPPTE